ncbi:similar to Saccharomyces cerevisiae YOR220W RCN2 Protein of unknown function [Maudiozyma saulgeensis]|uniref:Uncharacterized protein n=1 Tax=Maudiozyma saulgeensis TaxID=1789683 RepID=A0A1X7R457_9SACH|nr:similar to Saccharomyces cerevisiae YOR220W RCN2 Protein of unknown function [Kazachstania saulgeensis]
MLSISARMSQPKTQILITGIPKTRFTKKWPESLQSQLFEKDFPDYKAKLSYFTPLPFLSRIVIILDDETSAKNVYDYLLPIITKEGDDMKIFLTESLLLPRSRSFDDTENVSHIRRKSSVTESLLDSGKPILSLDTDPTITGVNATSLSIGSPSLSPDTANVGSPTLLKFSNDSKPYYYKEPLPQFSSQTNITSISDNSLSPSSSMAQTTSDSTEDKKSSFLKIDTSSTSVTSQRNDGLSTPKSPSITINQFVQ